MGNCGIYKLVLIFSCKHSVINFQIIEKLLEDKKSAKEELDNANEKIKAQQKEKDGKKYSLWFHFSDDWQNAEFN